MHRPNGTHADSLAIGVGLGLFMAETLGGVDVDALCPKHLELSRVTYESSSAKVKELIADYAKRPPT